MSCCNNTDYYPVNKTWSMNSGSATETTWSPFTSWGNWRQPVTERFYNNLANAWTVRGNVTPANSHLGHVLGGTQASRESFTHNPRNTYTRADNSWTFQRPYTST